MSEYISENKSENISENTSDNLNDVAVFVCEYEVTKHVTKYALSHPPSRRGKSLLWAMRVLGGAILALGALCALLYLYTGRYSSALPYVAYMFYGALIMFIWRWQAFIRFREMRAVIGADAWRASFEFGDTIILDDSHSKGIFTYDKFCDITQTPDYILLWHDDVRCYRLPKQGFTRGDPSQLIDFVKPKLGAPKRSKPNISGFVLIVMCILALAFIAGRLVSILRYTPELRANPLSRAYVRHYGEYIDELDDIARVSFGEHATIVSIDKDEKYVIALFLTQIDGEYEVDDVSPYRIDAMVSYGDDILKELKSGALVGLSHLWNDGARLYYGCMSQEAGEELKAAQSASKYDMHKFKLDGEYFYLYTLHTRDMIVRVGFDLARSALYH